MTELAYISAASHSGSTLLALLLGGHPEICTAGELKATHLEDVSTYRCSCHTLIQECGFWKRVSQAMSARGIQFDITRARTDFSGAEGRLARRLLRPLCRGRGCELVRDAALNLSPAWRRRYRDVQQRNAAFASALCEVTGKRIVVDSSKSGLRLKYLLRNPELNVRVLRLIRDGRGVALTYLDERPLTMAQAANEWLRANEEAECVKSQSEPGRWIEIRYEELCTHTNAVLTRVLEFLGVDATRDRKAFREGDNHVIGNIMRLRSDSEVRLDERWRSVLTQQQLREFEQVAGRLNRTYGYE